MRVIICGAGQVGSNIAAYLSQEGSDVTIIDTNAKLISQINNTLDVKGIVGYASSPDVLSAAGASDCDMIIAVTQSDEVNMVACQCGHSLFNIPKKIARIREQTYLKPAWSNLFSRSHMPIDVIISPEVVIANDIYQRLAVPGTSFVATLAGGLSHLIGVICQEECPMAHTPLGQLNQLFSDLAFQVICIVRNNKPIIAGPEEQIMPGDEVFFVVDTRHLRRTMSAFGNEEPEARKIVIAGGGNIGFGLANLLRQKGRGVQVKVIERNEERTKFLSENLENVIVLKGDSLDKQILEESAISDVETFVAVTNDDESNILASLLAKQHGCNRVVTLVNNHIYSSLVGPLGIDTLVSPRSTIVANIMQHVRRGRIKAIYNLRDGFAEVIEAEVSETSSLINMTMKEVELPGEILVAAIIRNDEFMLPTQNDVFKADDHVIILAVQDQTNNIEKMFSVHVDIF